MGKITKIIFIAILIIVIALIAFIAFTIYQAKSLIEIMQDESLKEDLQQLMTGDCTKLPAVESKLNSVEEKVISSCKNPVINYIVVKYSGQEDICEEISNSDSDVRKAFIQMKAFCNG